ncbi:hypothetical protein JGG51_24055, partial [Salmonella enterica subsp. enterica serovar Meleagridis]|nr:hypothetical protein [Salmonella enterica subsp. enterica serovar Meleagridis]
IVEEELENFVMPKKRVKIPPIIISECNKECNFKKLTEAIQAKMGHSNYNCKCSADGKLKIQLRSVDDFRDVQRLFREQNIYFCTNELSSDIPYKYILKGIHPSIPTEDIIQELEAMDFVAHKAIRMLRLVGWMMEFNGARATDRTKNTKHKIQEKRSSQQIKHADTGTERRGLREHKKEQHR